MLRVTCFEFVEPGRWKENPERWNSVWGMEPTFARGMADVAPKDGAFRAIWMLS